MSGTRIVVLLCAVLLLSSACVLAVRDKKFYDILGVSEDADDRTLKKAYKKQAL
jgi:preprotein translocase subunit Sec63